MTGLDEINELNRLLCFFQENGYFDRQPIQKTVFQQFNIGHLPFPEVLPRIEALPHGLSWSAESLLGLKEIGVHFQIPLSVRLVVYGVKPLALVHGKELELTGLLRWAQSNGLSGLLSPTEFRTHQDRSLNGYSNLLTDPRLPTPGSNADRGLLISSDGKYLVWAWQALLFGWDELLGKLLGYPDCCVEAFKRNWPVAVEEANGELGKFTIENSEKLKANWRMNIFGRYWGYELLNHFPCQLACAPSLVLAERYTHFLERYEPDFLEEIRLFLSHPVIVKDPFEVFAVREGVLKKRKNKITLEYLPENVLFSNPDSKERSKFDKHRSLSFYPGDHTIKWEKEHFFGTLVDFTNP